MKTTPEDFDKLSAYLRNQVGWVDLETVRKTIPAKHANGMKIEAMRFMGLLERDGTNVKLAEAGREYAAGDDVARQRTILQRLKEIPLYDGTLQWIHHNHKTVVSKTDIANYWHDNHSQATSGALGDALTDSAVFFMRMAGLAGVGKFVAAGAGRDTHLKIESEALAVYVAMKPTEDAARGPDGAANGGGADPRKTDLELESPRPPPIQLGVGTGLNINLEIHIAADAKPATVEEIFKNMRKYLLEQPDTTTNGG
jgi:hypothetical protein